MVNIRVIGTGEAFDSGLGNTSYLMEGQRLPTVLFDCGYQIPERLWSSNLHRKIDAVCLSHLHVDHAFGVVPLLTRYWEENRTRPLYIWGPKGTETYLTKLFNLGYPGFIKRLKFPLRYLELSSSRTVEWRGLRLGCAQTIHPITNHTVRIDINRPRSPSFAVSGDGRITKETRELVADVGLLLQEAYTLNPEIPVHADLKTIEAFISDSSVGAIGVAHHGRAHRLAIQKRVRKLARTDRRWRVLRPGMVLKLKRSPAKNY